MSGRSGRPVVLPEDRTTFDGPDLDVDARVGWLLRVSRMASVNPDNRALDRFAARLRGSGASVDGPRVSAWETGRTRVPESVFEHYESLLGVPAGALRTTCAGLRATFEGTPTVHARRPKPPQERLQGTLDAVYGAVVDGRARGGDWLALADLLGTDAHVLLPSAVAEGLIDVLLHEMVRSVGTAYTTRFDALSRLLAHPAHGPRVASSVETLVAEPGAQGVVDAMTVLGEATVDPAVSMLLKALASSDGSAQVGSAHALVNLLATGAFPADRLADLEDALREIRLGRPDPHSQAVARLLANRLGPDSRSRAGFTVEPARAAPPARSGAEDDEVDRVVAAACTSSKGVVPGIHRDVLLRRLVRESLASRFLERRHHASLLLMTSPYRDQVATATARAAELSTSRVTRRAVGLLLTYLAGPGQTSTMRRWLESDVSDLAGSALMSLAHGCGGVPETVDLAAVAASGRHQWAAVYAAGMSGHPALHAWASSEALPLSVRQSAQWWLDTGSAVRDEG